MVFHKVDSQPKFVDSGVYGLVRHPMYFGILLSCLAFLFVFTSLVSIGVWIVFFVVYDRMAAFEEQSLVGILGEEYVAYQKRVSKWFLGLHGRQRTATRKEPDAFKR
jgi:protein-S-isoprenylcysteine O-methyltransferase Ste14